MDPLAFAAVADGVTDYLDQVDHFLEHSELKERADILGEDPAQSLYFLLEDTDLVRITGDDEVIRMDLLLDGVVFTHRLTESEIAGDLVDFRGSRPDGPVDEKPGRAGGGAREELPPSEPFESLGPAAEELRDMMEQRWLHENVPPLGGMTPRQAVVDPNRREDLIALLRSFERMPAGKAITMRLDVLRPSPRPGGVRPLAAPHPPIRTTRNRSRARSSKWLPQRLICPIHERLSRDEALAAQGLSQKSNWNREGTRSR